MPWFIEASIRTQTDK